MTKSAIAQQAAEKLGPVTDEEMRAGFIAGSVAFALTEGGVDDLLEEIAETAGTVFDQWLAKRDTEIFGDGYDTGYVEGWFDAFNSTTTEEDA